MKKLILVFTLIIFGWSISEAKSPYYFGKVSFHTFYYSLAPYGEWIEIDYGVYAWRPLNISIGWSPYLIGRWVWTPYGWYWDSFEPFGWAVYHYGRWYYDDYYGWIWIPDYEWGPAWVEWRYSDVYIGWAPLPPYASFSITFGIRFSVNWHSPYYYWNFVPVKYFCGYEVHQFIIQPKYKYRIYRDTRHSIDYRYDNGKIINNGVDRNFIERKGGRIYETGIRETYRLRDFTDRKVNENGDVIIYRPDEKEFDRKLEVKVRKNDRQISLDLNKIQTPRERIDVREQRDRDPSNREQRKNFELEKKDRILTPEENRKMERRKEEQKIDRRRDVDLKIKNENYPKQYNPENRKINRNYEFRKELNQRNYEQLRNEQVKIETERNRENSRYENKMDNSRVNIERHEIRKRELDRDHMNSFERRKIR